MRKSARDKTASLSIYIHIYWRSCVKRTLTEPHEISGARSGTIYRGENQWTRGIKRASMRVHAPPLMSFYVREARGRVNGGQSFIWPKYLIILCVTCARARILVYLIIQMYSVDSSSSERGLKFCELMRARLRDE